jgi:ACS family glucarate transporter-like MFS transporter
VKIPFPPKRYLLVLGTFFLSVLLYVDRVCISAAKDDVSQSLGFHDKHMGWILSAFALGYALCQTPSGLLADRFGPQVILTAVVSFWSLFTGLTATAFNFLSMLVIRFLFGAGEAGAFPGMARAAYSWIPMSERGLVQGINFSGSRLGAAFALPIVAWMVKAFGWRSTFVILAAVGFAWALFWYFWFRDDPTRHPRISDVELKHILANRQQAKERTAQARGLSFDALSRSRNMWLAMAQYFCSNFTFFFMLTWYYPQFKTKYHLDEVAAGWYASIPFICGAAGNWFAGWLVDRIYNRGHWVLSRRLPAIMGFALAAAGLVGYLFMFDAVGATVCMSLAIFGADMTLSPSWAFCIDIGRQNAGAVSGTMNMAGNLGSFVTGLAFPYLLAWTQSEKTFFYIGAGLNALAIGIWLLMRPDKRWEEY